MATIAAYAYDAMNRRVSATETETSGTAFFHYDGASARVIAETDGSGATLATYAYDDRGQFYAMTRGGETYFYHLNARGDVVALSDASGDVVNTYRYDPWGTLLESDETVENPYRYASYRADTSTGLYYCWNRYCAPELGRFLIRDIYPGDTSDPVTMNPYLYCGGDPVNAVDPSGMMSANSVLAGALGLGAIVLGLVCIGLTVGSFGILAPETAAGLAVAAGALGTALGMISRVVTQQQYIDGELSPAEYRVQMMIAGAGTAASAGGAVYAACGGAASVMAAWLAVEGFNWSVTGGGLWLGQFLRDITRN